MFEHTRKAIEVAENLDKVVEVVLFVLFGLVCECLDICQYVCAEYETTRGSIP
jgi:hypothetical protein